LSAQTDEPPKPEPPRTLRELLGGLAPQGWPGGAGTKEYGPENLYQEIDGRAELFLAYDVVAMTCATFENPSDLGQYIAVSVYDMGTPTQAFGVFSVERSGGEPAVDCGRAAYRSDAHYYVWKGQYYAQVVASGTSEAFVQMAGTMARRVADFLADSGEPVWGLAALPQEGLVADSVRYFQVDALGLDFMRYTYTAEYRRGDGAVTAFVSRRDTADEARSVIGRYALYAEQYGKGAELTASGAVPLLVCDMKGGFDVVFQKGTLVGGILAVADRAEADRAAEDFWRALREE
jgi:hypothetical protein